jgi:hypothetical protein
LICTPPGWIIIVVPNMTPVQPDREIGGIMNIESLASGEDVIVVGGVLSYS